MSDRLDERLLARDEGEISYIFLPCMVSLKEYNCYFIKVCFHNNELTLIV